MMRRYRFVLLASAWLVYMAFTIAGHPFFGVSVMLPSILLCGLASWLYGYKTGLMTLILSHPYNTLAMTYNLDNLPTWHSALDPIGITVQLCAVFFFATIKNNHSKRIELMENLETRIEQRNKELEEIAKCLLARSKAEHSRMSETLCNIVTYQQTGLFYQSEALLNLLVYNGAPQADAASKLVQLAQENMEQVKIIARQLSSQKIVTSGIEHALHEMCTYFMEPMDIDFSIVISDDLEEMHEETFLNMYRIAHEVATNAMRHGKATHIALALKLDEENYVLEIINNGTPISSTPGESQGMKLIQDRADIINAMTRFETTTEGKSRFECIIPRHGPSLHCSGIKY